VTESSIVYVKGRQSAGWIVQWEVMKGVGQPTWGRSIFLVGYPKVGMVRGVYPLYQMAGWMAKRSHFHLYPQTPRGQNAVANPANHLIDSFVDPGGIYLSSHMQRRVAFDSLRPPRLDGDDG
jgi:hypothetical protein